MEGLYQCYMIPLEKNLTPGLGQTWYIYSRCEKHSDNIFFYAIDKTFKLNRYLDRQENSLPQL